MKITVYGIRYAVFGSDRKAELYFKSKETREAFIDSFENPFSLLRGKRVEESTLTPALRDTWDEDSVIPGAYEIDAEW